MAGLIITSVCLWLVLARVHGDDIARAAKSFRWLWLFPATGALAAGYGARIYRWWWMLRLCSPSVRLRACAWPLIAGFAVNNVVPFRAGDALRIVGFRRELELTAVQVLGSLLIERILDLTILLAFFVTGILGLSTTEIPPMYLRTAVIVAVVGAAGWILFLWKGDHLEALLLKVCRVKLLVTWNIGVSAEHYLRQFFLTLNLVRLPGAALKLLAVSAVAWSCEGIVFVTCAAGFDYGGRAFGPWFALSAGSLATMIPSSPGYVGTFDFFTTSGFGLYGATLAKATAITLMVHIVLWVPITVAGLTYLLFGRLKDRGGQFISRPTQNQEGL